MQEYEFGKERITWNAQHLEVASVDFDFAELASWRDFAHETEWWRGALFLLIS